MAKYLFPKDFVWGAATASYQIEGAVSEDGRGESIWDRYSSIPGNVLNGDTGDIACDHYHRYKQDVALMKEMGLKGYRFSIAWPRVYPTGRGEVNQKGLDFYSDLVDELLAAGITPYVTLYHWDLPQALQDLGGWANPDMPKYFLEFSKTVFDRLGDRVKHWMTLNEPYCAAFLGNYEGRMAPGLHDFSTAVLCAYYMYVGHGLVVEHFRQSGREGEIGIALNLMGRLPYSDSPEDLAAGKRADGYLNRWFIEPIVKGEYPQDMVELYREKGVRLPPMKPEHLALMKQPLDFIALNYYNDFHVKNDPARWPLGFRIQNRPFVTVNNRNWPVTEEGLVNMLLRLKNEYGVENLYISETGTSFYDVVSLDGCVHDSPRVDYLHRHVRAMHQAMEQGVNLKGCFLWSLYDNFEWAEGYTSRFGLVYIDYPTQQRIVKDSGKWYTAVIAAGGVD